MFGVKSYDTVISYREAGATSSSFLNVGKVLKSENISEIFTIYKNILHSINTLDPSKIDKIDELEKLFYFRFKFLAEKNRNADPLAIRVFKAIFSLGIYPCVRFFRQFLREKAIESVHQSFLHHISACRNKLLPKTKAPAIPELDDLIRSRVTNPNEELQRLKKDPRINRSLTTIENNCCYPLTESHQVAIAHSIELRERLKNKYYVVNHGQNLGLVVLNILARKLKQAFEPRQYEHFEVLRHDVSLAHINKEQTVEWFVEKMKTEIDKDYSRELISCDIHLESTAASESAIDFFAGTTNIACNFGAETFISSVMDKILTHYFPDPETRRKLSDEFVKLFSDLRGGALYSICIPKDQFDKVAYLSRQWGTPTRKGKYNVAHLERIQEGLDFTKSKDVPYERMGAGPQVRVLAHKLDPEKGILIIPQTTLGPEKMDELEKQIDLLLQQAQMQFRIQ